MHLHDSKFKRDIQGKVVPPLRPTHSGPLSRKEHYCQLLFFQTVPENRHVHTCSHLFSFSMHIHLALFLAFFP